MLRASFAVLYGQYGIDQLGASFELTESKLLPFVIEVVRRFPPVAGYANLAPPASSPRDSNSARPFDTPSDALAGSIAFVSVCWTRQASQRWALFGTRTRAPYSAHPLSKCVVCACGSLPSWDRRTNHHTVVDLLMASADTDAWGARAADFVLRPMHEYHQKSVMWADVSGRHRALRPTRA